MKGKGRPPSRGAGRGRDAGAARPRAGSLHAGHAGKAPPRDKRDGQSRQRLSRQSGEESLDHRSFDGSPRRRRDREWDMPRDGGWDPADDLADVDLSGLEGEARRVRPDTAGARIRGDGSRRTAADRPRSSRNTRDGEAPTKAEQRALATETLQTGVQSLAVAPDEDGLRVDRFLTARFPQLSFSLVQRIVRKGELRVNGKRADAKDRLAAGDTVRVPPLKLEPQRPMSARAGDDARTFLSSITLYEDADVLVIAKPAGLAVQGGSGTTKHVDGMLMALADADGQRPRLVHRLDKDTSGCLLIAKTRFAASALARTFRTRAARKIYWAVVAGVPKPRQGRVSTFLAKEEREDESRMRIARHGEKGASHAVSYYAVVDTMAQKLAWLSMKPVTGRTHQLRVHAAEIGHAIVGDPKYFDIENWELPGGIQQKLHLHARRLVVPHPRGRGTIDVSAPLPPHMEQTFNLVGWDASRYDPIVEAPEE